MLPEISRRCTSCGGAVRAGARFCPQCGKVMAGAETQSNAAESRAAQSSVEGPSDARGSAETARGAGDSTTDDAAQANDNAAHMNDSVAPVTRDAEAPGEWVKPTREFSAFVGSLADEVPRGGEGPRASSQEGATASAPDAREGSASRTTTASDFVNAGDVANSVNYANAGDYASACDVARAGDFAGGVESV